MAVRSPLDDELESIAASGKTPRLLIHCCCAPCASYALEYLSPFFAITAFYFNPNIEPVEEHIKRGGELRKLVGTARYPNQVNILEYGDYARDNSAFKLATEALVSEPEGGRRCSVCIETRLAETAMRARVGGYDYFATTLTVSPHKNAALINETGRRLGSSSGVAYLASDFKKRDGYKRSIELSGQFGLYRQSYCGCLPSLGGAGAVG